MLSFGGHLSVVSWRERTHSKTDGPKASLNHSGGIAHVRLFGFSVTKKRDEKSNRPVLD